MVRVNCDAINLRKLFLHSVFQYRGHIVDLRDRQTAFHCAMAGHKMWCSTCRPGRRGSYQFVEFRRQLVEELSIARESCFISPTPVSGVAMCLPSGSM